MPKKNKIVVTGGAGFVGTNLIKILLKKLDIRLLVLITILQGENLTTLKIVELNI